MTPSFLLRSNISRSLSPGGHPRCILFNKQYYIMTYGGLEDLYDFWTIYCVYSGYIQSLLRLIYTQNENILTSAETTNVPITHTIIKVWRPASGPADGR